MATIIDIRTYAATVRQALPGVNVPEKLDTPDQLTQFFTADRQYITNLQKKLNEFLRIESVAAALGDQGNPFAQLEITGFLDGRTQLLIDRITKAAPAIDPKKIYSAEYDAYFAMTSRFDESGGWGAHKAAQFSAEQSEKQVNEMKGMVGTLQNVLAFHTQPDSDYFRAKNDNPIMGMKMTVQEGGFAQNAATRVEAPLSFDNKLEDWGFALGTRKYALTLQKFLNQVSFLTGAPRLPETGKYSDAMRTAMETYLTNPEAKTREEYAAIRRSWDIYSKLKPDQHATMETALDQGTQKFIDLFTRARIAQLANTNSSTLPALDGLTNEQKLDKIEEYLKTYVGQNSQALRDTLEAAQPGARDWVRKQFGYTWDKGLSDDEINFLVNYRGHFMEVRDLKKAEATQKPIEPPKDGAERNLFNLQQQLLTRSREIYQTGENIPVFYGAPAGNMEVSGRAGDVALSYNVAQLSALAQQIAVVNLSRPDFAAHLMSQTGLSRKALLDLPEGQLDEKMKKVMQSIVSYRGTPPLQGLNGEMKETFRKISSLSAAQVTQITNAPFEALRNEVSVMGPIITIGSPRRDVQGLDTSLADSYAGTINKFHSIIRSRADFYASLYKYVDDPNFSPAAKVFLKNISDQLEAANPTDGKPESRIAALRKFFMDFPPKTETMDGSRLSGQPNDPTAAFARMVISLKDKQIVQVEVTQPDGTKKKDYPAEFNSAWFIENMNRSVAAMTPAQRENFDRVLLTVDPRVKDMKKFINDNLARINTALPAADRIPGTLTVNGNINDPAFLRAMNSLQKIDNERLYTAVRDGLDQRVHAMLPLMRYIKPQMLAAELSNGRATINFADPLKALESVPLLEMKRNLSRLAGNKIFTGIQAFDSSMSVLDEKEKGFVRAYGTFLTKSQQWLTGLPPEINQAVALSPDDIHNRLKTALNSPEKQAEFDTATFAYAIGHAPPGFFAFTEEQLKTLPEGSYGLDEEGGFAIDSSKLGANGAAALKTLMEQRKAAMPADQQPAFDSFIYQSGLELASERGILPPHAAQRINFPEGITAPGEYVGVLLGALDDPSFSQRLSTVPEGMTKPEYIQQLRTGLESITTVMDAIVANQPLAARLETAYADLQRSEAPPPPPPPPAPAAAPGTVLAGGTPAETAAPVSNLMKQAQELMARQIPAAGSDLTGRQSAGGASGARQPAPGTVPNRPNGQ